MKRLYPFIAGTTAVFLFAFVFKPNLNSSSHFKKSIKGIDLNPALYPLFIENSVKNPQLDDLLSLEKKGFILDHFKKVIFQYYYQDNIKGFTLTAYLGSRKQKKFEQKVIQLSSYNSCGTYKSAVGPNVYMGDFEFIHQKEAIKKLQDLAADKTKNVFIVFFPSLETETMNGISRINVNYTLYSVTALSEICNIGINNIASKDSILTVAPVGASTNPSPPHGGN